MAKTEKPDMIPLVHIIFILSLFHSLSYQYTLMLSFHFTVHFTYMSLNMFLLCVCISQAQWVLGFMNIHKKKKKKISLHFPLGKSSGRHVYRILCTIVDWKTVFTEAFSLFSCHSLRWTLFFSILSYNFLFNLLSFLFYILNTSCFTYIQCSGQMFSRAKSAQHLPGICQGFATTINMIWLNGCELLIGPKISVSL